MTKFRSDVVFMKVSVFNPEPLEKSLGNFLKEMNQGDLGVQGALRVGVLEIFGELEDS